MKENIYTIPINDAFDADSECPICEFFQKEEKGRVEYSLGASMMEPDERIASNELGYCVRHTQMMYDFGNKLSHALVLETRLKFLTEEIKKYRNSVKKPKSIFVKGKDATGLSHSDNCLICTRLNKIMEDFVANIFYLYKKEPEFKNKFLNSKGFCLKHFEMLANSAYDNLGAQSGYEFIRTLCDIEEKNLNRVTEDIEWFSKKFDYRYKDEDWKNSKDAVIRASRKISSYIEEK